MNKSVIIGLALLASHAFAAEKTVDVLWRNPANITSHNLFYRPGDRSHAPRGPFTFVKEDLNGTNPKFDVADPSGIKWKVKIGEEAQPETVASRLVWAAGYFTDEDYFMREIRVKACPNICIADRRTSARTAPSTTCA